MIASIISAISGVIQIILSWMASARDATLRALGATQQRESDLRGQIDAGEKADKARESVRVDLELHPDKLRVDDGFKRPDADA